MLIAKDKNNSQLTLSGNNYGFTIVELLVVIVVIGILASITIISYSNINQRAIVASIKSDLASSSTKFKMFQTFYGVYPILDSNNCPTNPVDSEYCLKSSAGNAYSFLSQPNSSEFSITITHGTQSYNIDQNSTISEGAGVWYSGIVGTAMEDKYVYNVDPGTGLAWRTTGANCSSPQCTNAGSLDPDYPSNYVLVNPQTNPSVDFSDYPAQNACKTIGGRLPNMQELLAIYDGKNSYGSNFILGKYFSATQSAVDSPYVLEVDFGDSGKLVSDVVYGTTFHARCVKD